LSSQWLKSRKGFVLQHPPKYKDFILPLIFAKRLCDVFDDEINRIAEKVGSRAKAFKLVAKDNKLVRFYLSFVPDDPNEPVWSVIRKLTSKVGEEVTFRLREIAKHNQLLDGIIDRVDFNATTHGVRDIEDDRLSNLIEKISEKRLGLKDVEANIIGRSYAIPKLQCQFADATGANHPQGWIEAVVEAVSKPSLDQSNGTGGKFSDSSGLHLDRQQSGGGQQALSANDGRTLSPSTGRQGRGGHRTAQQAFVEGTQEVAGRPTPFVRRKATQRS